MICTLPRDHRPACSRTEAADESFHLFVQERKSSTAYPRKQKRRTVQQAYKLLATYSGCRQMSICSENKMMFDYCIFRIKTLTFNSGYKSLVTHREYEKKLGYSCKIQKLGFLFRMSRLFRVQKLYSLSPESRLSGTQMASQVFLELRAPNAVVAVAKEVGKQVSPRALQKTRII